MKNKVELITKERNRQVMNNYEFDENEMIMANGRKIKCWELWRKLNVRCAAAGDFVRSPIALLPLERTQGEIGYMFYDDAESQRLREISNGLEATQVILNQGERVFCKELWGSLNENSEMMGFDGPNIALMLPSYETQGEIWCMFVNEAIAYCATANSLLQNTLVQKKEVMNAISRELSLKQTLKKLKRELYLKQEELRYISASSLGNKARALEKEKATLQSLRQQVQSERQQLQIKAQEYIQQSIQKAQTEVKFYKERYEAAEKHTYDKDAIIAELKRGNHRLQEQLRRCGHHPCGNAHGLNKAA